MDNISWADRDGTRWIELEGELDHQSCLDLRDRFHEAVKSGDGDVILVLQGVTFLGSMAVGMMLRARQTLTEAGRALKLTGIPSNVRSALDLMNLTQVFEVI